MATYHLGNIDITDLRTSLPRGAGIYETRPIGQIKRIVIHHSASAATTTAAQMANWHVQKGWPGIAYDFVVLPSGEIQYTKDHTLIGYGVSYENADTVHICLPGDFTSTPPPAAQLAATRTLIDNYCLAMGAVYPVVGHRDIAHDGSVCPGDTWAGWKGQLVGMPDQPADPTDWKAEAERYRRELEAANTKIGILQSALRSIKTTAQNYV